MKNIIIKCLVVIFLLNGLFISGCGETEEAEKANEQEDTLNVEEVKNIFELVTLDVEIENVATGTKEKGEGFTHWFEKDRDYMVSYTSEAKVSYDLNKVKIEQEGNNIKITLPPPDVECKTKENSMNMVIEPDSINSNKVDDEEMQAKVDEANAELEEQLKQNSSLMKSAEDQAKTLITNHINQINDAKGTEYKVTFIEKIE